jgi:iron complex transport system substrate-binding protein
MKKSMLALLLAGLMGFAAACGTASSAPTAGSPAAPADDSSASEAAPASDSSTSEAAPAGGSSASEAAPADSGAPELEGDRFPVTITHAYGETVIEQKPERVATVAFGNQDVVLALGVVPVGFSAANYGVQDDSGLLPWTAEKLAELGCAEPNVFQDTDGLDFEAINDCDPDIILAPYSGLSEEDYELLGQIAPVVPFPDTAWTISWRDWITVIAQALGLSAEGDALVAEMETRLSDIPAAHPEFAGKSFVWISFNETDLSSLHAYSPVDARCAFLSELGFNYPESVSQYMVDGQYSLSLSAENADLLYDADFIIGYSTQSAYAAAQADPVLGEIPALKNNAIVSIENGTPLAASLTITPLSFFSNIDNYVEKLADAVANANAK